MRATIATLANAGEHSYEVVDWLAQNTWAQEGAIVVRRRDGRLPLYSSKLRQNSPIMKLNRFSER